jgi:hypothetical protein
MLRLFFIILGSLALSFFVWVCFYFWGFSRPIFKHENTFLPSSKIFLYINEIKNTEALSSEDGVFLKVTLSNSVLLCNEMFCHEFLKKYGSKKMLIRLDHNMTDIHNQFATVFDSLKNRKDIGFVSRYPYVTSSIKTLLPLWSYGISEVEQTKIKVFESIGLTHLPDVKGDFWISSHRSSPGNLLTPAIFEDMRRRQKSIIVENIQKIEDLNLVLGLGVDAVVVEDLTWDRLKSNL